MEELSREVRRRTFRWPGAAREMVEAYRKDAGSKSSGVGEHMGLKELISNLATISGNPRSACWRLVRQWGVKSTRSYRQWTKPEQQRLLDLIACRSLVEVAFLLRRSRTSVRSMLHRLGANARMGEDWFTKHALAEALHVRTDEVQKWMPRGWLKCRIVSNNGLRRELIEAEDFCEFCKQHHRDIVGNRLNADRLDFVQTFVFPPSHADLLPVRNAKKEQEAFDEQVKNEAGWETDAEDELSATAQITNRRTTISRGGLPPRNDLGFTRPFAIERKNVFSPSGPAVCKERKSFPDRERYSSSPDEAASRS